MSKSFNLFLLHSPYDIHPRTWICIKGEKIKFIIKNLEKEVLREKNLSRESLSRKISVELKCSIGAIKRVIRGNDNFYPIPIIFKLLEMSSRKKFYSGVILKNTKYLKINSASSRQVKATRLLTHDLAKILGAFMADGSLSVQILISDQNKNKLDCVIKKLEKLNIKYSTGNAMSRNQHYVAIQINSKNKNLLKIFNKHKLLIQSHYNIELTEEYRDSVLAFNKWIYKTFSIRPTNFYKKKNAWRTIFSNKILARYLMCFFDIIPGPKTYTAFEPKLIEKSDLKLRKCFAKGVLMFDGCVSKSNKILFSSKSKLLYSSIQDIWKLDKINFSGYLSNRNEWTLSSTEENNKSKFFDYFEKDTQKSKLLKWIFGDMNSKPIIHNNSKFLSTKEILKILKIAKICDIEFIVKTTDKKYLTIKKYLNILKSQRKIKISRNPKNISPYINENTNVFLDDKKHELIFNEIRKKFTKDKNFYQLVDIKKGTFSAWRKRKSGIPIKTLKKMSDIIKIRWKEIVKHIQKTDRDIVEII